MSGKAASRAPRVRLDQLLVDRGLAETLARADALLRAGLVLVADAPADKPGTKVASDAPVRLRASAPDPARYVSRGGQKLEAALDSFGVQVRDRVAADLGASTGGFTDCLLRRGVGRVYAIDVGYGQLAWSLRQDPRVVVLERTNVRTLERLPEAVDLVVGDLSFISLVAVLPAIARIAAPGAEAVLLLKPQFEARPGQVGRGGVAVGSAREEAIEGVLAAVSASGWTVLGRRDSPLPGAKRGNVEHLVHVRLPGSAAAG